MYDKLAVSLLLLLTTSISSATELLSRKICAWDPVGRNGPVISFFADLVPQAIPWGLDLEFIPYSDEKQAAQDLAEGRCEIAIVTAILSRDFVQFAGTLDAIGGITSIEKLRRTIATIASPKATPLMSDSEFEVVASLPVGSMFAFVRDRRIDNIDAFRGRPIAVLNGDKQVLAFAELAGAIPVEETLSTFARSFNQGHVDIVLMPALAYNTFELYRGLRDTGGIMDERMFYGMLQAIARRGDFADDFGYKVRHYMVSRLNEMLAMIKTAEESIPKRYWIETSVETKQRLREFYKEVRLTLKVEEAMDPKALSLLWKIRCSESPEQEECQMP